MTYADYEYYKSSFLGDYIPEEEFARLAERATEYIDHMTFLRAREAGEYAEAVKNACCALAETFLKNEKGGGIVSETVGQLTRSYAIGVSKTPTEAERLLDTLCKYLLHTGLLYLGEASL